MFDQSCVFSTQEDRRGATINEDGGSKYQSVGLGLYKEQNPSGSLLYFNGRKVRDINLGAKQNYAQGTVPSTPHLPPAVRTHCSENTFDEHIPQTYVVMASCLHGFSMGGGSCPSFPISMAYMSP